MTITREEDITLLSGGVVKGILSVPEVSEALIIFAHGSGSSRLSKRNRYVADKLNKAGFATFLVDLLTPEEDQDIQNRFDIDLLAQRLLEVTNALLAMGSFDSCRIGYFGASTGAASALKAAVLSGGLISAVVSRGGRPDLATGALGKVKCPVLLIVGSLDGDVIILNRKALALMGCEKKLVIVDGATHLFEEKGKLEEVAELATEWFSTYLKDSNKS